MRCGQVQLDGVLRNAVGVLGFRHHFLGDRRFARPVHGDRGSEHETLDTVLHGLVDEVDRSDQIVSVIEMADEVAQSFGSVRCKMIDVVEAAVIPETRDKAVVYNAPALKDYAIGNVVDKSARKIIDAQDLEAHIETMPREMRSNETRDTGDERLC